ncbi:pentatricopeptide repeat-containing protein At1g62350 [Nymphaea colorata]|nr:pentatricopeptide repeat-containing protein At1g62350 [Nymphaea colorata]
MGMRRFLRFGVQRAFSSSYPSSSPSLSIWRGKRKEMGKEGLMVVQEMKRLQNSPPERLQSFIKSRVSRLLKSDLLAVLAEFQRQDNVSLCLMVYELVRKEIWYKPDMFFYRDMLMMLAQNKQAEKLMQVWEDSKREKVHFDQHTYGDIIRCLLDNNLPSQAMVFYSEMKESPEPPLSLPYRVILKGLVPYPELREKVKEDFLELFPGMFIYDPPDGLTDN